MGRPLEVALTLLYSLAMTKRKVGQKAPNVELYTLAGEPVALESLWGNGRFALLLFLRHLA